MHACDRYPTCKTTGIDLNGERSGLLPSREWKRRVHGTIWYPGETLIAGIGQGYMLTTPLQLATATTALANKGTMVSPRLVTELRDADGTTYETIASKKTEIKLKHSSHWDIVRRAMRDVIHGRLGTARATGWKIKFKMAGKTGTAQVFSIGQDEEYDEKTVARKLRDHGLFIGFAPYKNPAIAVAVIGENGEHGSAAAPIAAKIMQRYFEKISVQEKGE
jgi:penicillin-binding protein 2